MLKLILTRTGFKIATWNVAGLRALMKKDPESLSSLCARHDLDMLCLQETKLQESHVEGIGGIEGYKSYFSCSTAKKGYSGTAVFLRNKDKAKQSPEVSFGLGIPQHDEEGRSIWVEFPSFSLLNLYVPNSGQTLQRLDYRTEQWDKDLLSVVQKRDKPTIWLGDLNVAHRNLDIWNDGAKHLSKQAGVTAEERASFQAQLDSGYIDAFRHLHPTAEGHYTYWSQRAGNREPNKGLRLDYFVCDKSFFEPSSSVVVRDSYMDPSQKGSDHCPAILVLEIKDD